MQKGCNLLGFSHKNLPVKPEVALRHVEHELLTHTATQRVIKDENITLSTFATEYADGTA